MSAGTPGTAEGVPAAPSFDGTPAGTAPLVGVFVRLKLSLLKGGLRQSPGRTATFVVSGVLTVVLAGGCLFGLTLLRGVGDAAALTTLLTLVLALGWAVMPLFFAAGDETLDSSRLAMLPLRPRQLTRALLAASLVGFGPVFSLCLLAGCAIATARGPAGTVFGVVGVVVALLTYVGLARAVAAANVRLLSSRRGRDLAVLSGLVIAVGAQFVSLGVQRLAHAGGLSALEPTARVVRWIPPASAMDAVDSASRGAYGQAAGQLLLALAVLVAVVNAWQRSLVRLMTSPDSSTIAAAEPLGRRRADGRGRGLGRVLPESRTGTVMRRTLRYAWRDPKTKAAWVTSLAIGLIVPVVNALEGSGTIYLACLAAGLLGIQTFNQFGQDTSAFWMVAQTIASRRDAALELRGRALALLLVTVPYTALVTVLLAVMLGAWGAFAETLGLAFALLGAMLGIGAVASSRFPYAVPQGSRRNAAPGQAGLVWISLFGGMVGSVVACLPVLALMVWLHASGATGLTWVLLPTGIVYGAAAAVSGTAVASGILRDRLPEILAAVSKS